MFGAYGKQKKEKEINIHSYIEMKQKICSLALIKILGGLVTNVCSNTQDLKFLSLNVPLHFFASLGFHFVSQHSTVALTEIILMVMDIPCTR